MISAVPKSFQISPECTIQRLLFFTAVPIRFKYRQNAPFSVLVFIFSLQFQIFFKYRQNAPFSVLVFMFSLQFQIVSNTVRMHHLVSLFSFFLFSFKSFQIPSECTIQRPCFHFFSSVSNTVRMHHLASLFSKFSAKFQIVLNAVKKHQLLSLFSKFPGGYPSPRASPCFGTNYVLFVLLKFQISFKKVSKGNLQRQILPNSIRRNALKRPCFQNCLLKFQIFSNSDRIYALDSKSCQIVSELMLVFSLCSSTSWSRPGDWRSLRKVCEMIFSVSLSCV